MLLLGHPLRKPMASSIMRGIMFDDILDITIEVPDEKRDVVRLTASGWEGEVFTCPMTKLMDLDSIDHAHEPGIFVIGWRYNNCTKRCQWVGGDTNAAIHICSLPEWRDRENCEIFVAPIYWKTDLREINEIVDGMAHYFQPVHPLATREIWQEEMEWSDSDPIRVNEFMTWSIRMANHLGFTFAKN